MEEVDQRIGRQHRHGRSPQTRLGGHRARRARRRRRRCSTNGKSATFVTMLFPPH